MWAVLKIDKKKFFFKKRFKNQIVMKLKFIGLNF